MTTAEFVPPDASAIPLSSPPAPGARGHLLRGSAYSLASVAAGAATAAVFWLVAARLYPVDAVGRASALFSSLLFVTFVTNLGIPVAVARYGSEAPDTYRSLVAWSLLAAGVSATAVGAVFVVAVPDDVTAPLREWGMGPAVSIFAALAGCTALTLVIDTRLMVARQWPWVLVRVAAAGALRIPLLWLAAIGNDAFWVFLLCALPPALSGLVALASLRRLTGSRLRLRPGPTVARAASRYAGVNYLATLASDAARFALPLLVVLHVTPSENASFYVAWGVTLVAFLVPVTIGQVLLTEGSRADGHAAAQSRQALVLAVALMAAASLVCWAFADVIVSLYGSGYREAARILPTLMAAGVPWAITSICLADARLRRDSRSTLLITVTMGISVLGAALLLVPDRGVDGATAAWLAGNAIAAVVGTVLTLVARHGRRVRAGGA